MDRYSDSYTSASRALDSLRHDLAQLTHQRDEWQRKYYVAVAERDAARDAEHVRR